MKTVLLTFVILITDMFSKLSSLSLPDDLELNCINNFACIHQNNNFIRMGTKTNANNTSKKQNVFASADECRLSCQASKNCQHFTWYNENGSFPFTCYLYTSCNKKEIGCQGCYSGKQNCQTKRFRSCSAINSSPAGGTWYCYPLLFGVDGVTPVPHDTHCIFRCLEYTSFHHCYDGAWDNSPEQTLEKCRCPPLKPKSGSIICWPPKQNPMASTVSPNTYCLHTCHGHPKNELRCQQAKWTLDQNNLTCHAVSRNKPIFQASDSVNLKNLKLKSPIYISDVLNANRRRINNISLHYEYTLLNLEKENDVRNNRPKLKKFGYKLLANFSPRMSKLTNFSPTMSTLANFSSTTSNLTNFRPKISTLTNFSPIVSTLPNYSSTTSTLANFRPNKATTNTDNLVSSLNKTTRTAAKFISPKILFPKKCGFTRKKKTPLRILYGSFQSEITTAAYHEKIEEKVLTSTKSKPIWLLKNITKDSNKRHKKRVNFSGNGISLTLRNSIKNKSELEHMSKKNCCHLKNNVSTKPLLVVETNITNSLAINNQSKDINQKKLSNLIRNLTWEPIKRKSTPKMQKHETVLNYINIFDRMMLQKMLKAKSSHQYRSSRSMDVGCPPLKQYDNGRINCNGHRFKQNNYYKTGSICYLTCDEGWVPLGNSQAECGQSGDWIVPHGDVLMCDEAVAVLIGGWSVTEDGIGHVIADAEIFSPRTGDSNRMIAPLPKPRKGLIVAWLDGKIFACGGDVSAVMDNRCYSYDPSQNAWLASVRNTGAHEQSRHFASGIVRHNKLFVFGGRSDGLYPRAMSSVESLEGKGCWQKHAELKLSFERAYHCAVLLSDGKTVAITGGFSHNSVLKEVESIDLLSKNSSWTKLKPMNIARYLHSCSALKNMSGLLVAGGSSSSTEIFYPKENYWKLTGPLSFPRQGAQMLILDGKPTILGGFHVSTNRYPTTVEQYIVENQNWISVVQQIIVPRRYFGTTLVPKSLFK